MLQKAHLLTASLALLLAMSGTAFANNGNSGDELGAAAGMFDNSHGSGISATEPFRGTGMPACSTFISVRQKTTWQYSERYVIIITVHYYNEFGVKTASSYYTFTNELRRIRATTLDLIAQRSRYWQKNCSSLNIRYGTNVALIIGGSKHVPVNLFGRATTVGISFTQKTTALKAIE